MTADAGRDSGASRAGELEWLKVSEGLVAGINHALNNRLAALGAAGQVLEADLPAGHPLSGIFTAELQKLEKAVALLRSLTGGEADFEPTVVEDVLGQARQLVAVDHALRDHPLEIACAGGLFPLWVQPAGLLRVIMLMVHAASRRSGDPLGALAIAAAGDERLVSIEVSAPGGSAGEEDGGPGAGLVAYAALLGGTLDRSDTSDRVGVRLTLPTLPEVRRRERGS